MIDASSYPICTHGTAAALMVKSARRAALALRRFTGSANANRVRNHARLTGSGLN